MKFPSLKKKYNVNVEQLFAIAGVGVGMVLLGILNPVALITGLGGFAVGLYLNNKYPLVFQRLFKRKPSRVKQLEAKVKALEKQLAVKEKAKPKAEKEKVEPL